MKVREAMKLLRDDGWYEVRMRGSHRVLQHPHKTGSLVLAGNPGDDVPKGLLHAMLKRAQLEDRS